MHIVLKNQHLDRLKEIADHSQVINLLQFYSGYRLRDPSVIKNYHDLLLFYCAFPFNNKIYKLAEEELKRVALTVSAFHHNTKKKAALMNSGISNTELYCSYSRGIAGMLVKKFNCAVELGSGDASEETVRNIIQSLLPAVEFEKISQGELGLTARLKTISGLQKPADLLKWLLELFEDPHLPEMTKEELYRQLKVFIRWKLDDGSFSRTFLRWPVTKICYQKSFIKKVNSAKIVKQKIGNPVLLSSSRKKELADTMKASLAFYCRETDPITYTDEEELELFDMGRGLQIAVAGMVKEKRLALESYMGFMAFKNGVPVSYGGGWIWGHQCKIGVNIYEPFRRGESAWLFCQVLRLYYQHFGVRQFIVKPYQFGKGNPEGLVSGAFWFYYKLGFRNVSDTIKNEVLSEWKKLQMTNGHRTPLKLLKRFASGNIEWVVNKVSGPQIDPGKLSKTISTYINLNFNGNRKQALSDCRIKMKRILPFTLLKTNTGPEKQVLDNWALLTGLLEDISTWKLSDKRKLARLIQSKQIGREQQYILLLQKNKYLWSSVHRVITEKG